MPGVSNDFSTTDTVKIEVKFAPAVPWEILLGAWARQDLCAIVSSGIMHSNCAPEERTKRKRENKKEEKGKKKKKGRKKRKGTNRRVGRTIDREEKKSPLDSRGKREDLESALAACTSIGGTRASRESWIWKKKRRNALWQMWSRRKRSLLAFKQTVVSTRMLKPRLINNPTPPLCLSKYSHCRSYWLFPPITNSSLIDKKNIF